MKTTNRIIIFFIASLVMVASAHALTPRKQLSQMVQQLQKNPSDNALREKIIKLGARIRPALPDTAIEFEGRARFGFEKAKSEADYLAAAREYEKAVAAAPWVPGYYSDLCTIYEKANNYEDAKRNCEFYLIGVTDPAQRQDIKRRIAGLKYGMEQNSPSAVVEREKKALAKLDGGQWQEIDPTRCINNFIEIHRGEIFWGSVVVRYVPTGNCSGGIGDLVEGPQKTKLEGRRFVIRTNTSERTGTISNDGDSIMVSGTYGAETYTRVIDPRWNFRK